MRNMTLYRAVGEIDGNRIRAQSVLGDPSLRSDYFRTPAPYTAARAGYGSAAGLRLFDIHAGAPMKRTPPCYRGPTIRQ